MFSDTPAITEDSLGDDPDLIAAQNASRTAAGYRTPRCLGSAAIPAARAHFDPVVCDTAATVAAADCDNPDLKASKKTSRAEAGTSLLPCLRNPIEQHP